MKKIIAFSKFNVWSLVFSFIVTGTLIAITVFRGGFNLGIDFVSGQTIVASIPSAVSSKEIHDILEEDFPKVLVTQVDAISDKSFNIKISSTEEEQETRYTLLEEKLSKAFENTTIVSASFISGTLSSTLFRSAILLSLVVMVLILAYLGMRFKFRFALAAMVALIHDALFVLGIIGALQIEITVSTIAAILTIIGYSLNDTIVIFDRIRENITLMKGASFSNITDSSITKTLSRTIITTLTTVLAVVALYVFASGDVQVFAQTLLIGLVEGVWSSVFIATPMLYLFGMHKKVVSLENQQQGYEDRNSTKNILLDTATNNNSKLSDAEVATKATKLKQEILAIKKKRKKK